MKIVGIAACTSGIAHTYIAKEKLIRAAQEAGHEVHIETQGTIGTEEELTSQDIAGSGKERFKGKKTIEIPTSVCIKSSKQLIKKIEDELGK